MTERDGKKPHQVYTLLVQVGRKAGDGLPEGAVGAGMLCFASGRSEDEAVRETVAVLKAADLAPLDVTSYGTPEERRAQGHEIGAEEVSRVARERLVRSKCTVGLFKPEGAAA